jgi:hypothetical protein
MAETPDPHTQTLEALHAFRARVIQEVDNEIENLKRVAGEPVGTQAVAREVALLNALSRRESDANNVVMTTFLALKVEDASHAVEAGASVLSSRLERFTEALNSFGTAADAGTKRLVLATWVLAVAAIVAALIQAYAILTVAPQIIAIPPAR